MKNVTAAEALKALKGGRSIQASFAKGSSIFYRMFYGDVIILMERVTTCASKELERLTEENFLTRGETSDFVTYD